MALENFLGERKQQCWIHLRQTIVGVGPREKSELQGHWLTQPWRWVISLWCGTRGMCGQVSWPHLTRLLLSPGKNIVKAADGSKISDGPIWRPQRCKDPGILTAAFLPKGKQGCHYIMEGSEERTQSLGAHSLSTDSCKASILNENFGWTFLLFSQDNLILSHSTCSSCCNWPFSSEMNSTAYDQQKEFRYCAITSFKF